MKTLIVWINLEDNFHIIGHQIVLIWNRRTRSTFTFVVNPKTFITFISTSDLLILLSGSLAVLADVNFFFIPLILAQNDALRLFPTFLLGALRLDPGFSLSYDFLPFSLSPPDLFFPSFLVHAADSTYKNGCPGSYLETLKLCSIASG